MGHCGCWLTSSHSKHWAFRTHKPALMTAVAKLSRQVMSQRGMAEVVKLALTWENGSSERPGRGQAHGGVPGVGLKTVPGSPPGRGAPSRCVLARDQRE